MTDVTPPLRRPCAADRAAGRRHRGAAGFGLAVALVLSACSGSKDKDLLLKEEPVEILYNKAVDAMNGGDDVLAAQTFEEVDRQHPYSAWATRAQLMAAYAFYRAERYVEAVTAFDRFISLQPSHPDTPYAYYMKALCYYQQISDVSRDQKMTQDALKALEDVVKRYPESKYARDARLKIDLTQDHLAGKEMDVGRFYQKQNQPLAAINRYRTVIEKFQTTTHVPEALHRLVELYLGLGVRHEAQMAAAVLGHNFPTSEWYQDSYALLGGDLGQAGQIASAGGPKGERRSWLARTFGF